VSETYLDPVYKYFDACLHGHNWILLTLYETDSLRGFSKSLPFVDIEAIIDHNNRSLTKFYLLTNRLRGRGVRVDDF
jgi:hypothetical protein